MEGNSAKKAPVLDRLVDTKPSAAMPKKPTANIAQTQPVQQQKPAEALKQNQVPKAACTPTANGSGAPTKDNMTTVETLDTPKNRRTDKSQFEIELTQIVNRIMSQHINRVSEQIVQQVLCEVRKRLPGQRKQ